MKKEIAAVVFFLKRLIKKAEKLYAEKLDLFVERLTVALQEKYKGHWYPDNPSKGQAFRCIRVNRFHKEDAELLRACAESGVQYKDLGLPKELTLWVDPGEVCCRYGERNHGFTVATFSSDDDDDKEDVTKKVTSTVERNIIHACSARHVKMSYICILCRCIRVNRFHKEDAELLRACAESGVQYKDLGLPKELTLWVDPGEVCCR
uniref:B-cell translocation gene 3 n=1 Tax=Sinocyclocheilus rhinocerous TaxID=307959 RepID=A0A673MGZ6_9TELE